MKKFFKEIFDELKREFSRETRLDVMLCKEAGMFFKTVWSYCSLNAIVAINSTRRVEHAAINGMRVWLLALVLGSFILPACSVDHIEEIESEITNNLEVNFSFTFGDYTLENGVLTAEVCNAYGLCSDGSITVNIPTSEVYDELELGAPVSSVEQPNDTLYFATAYLFLETQPVDTIYDVEIPQELVALIPGEREEVIVVLEFKSQEVSFIDDNGKKLIISTIWGDPQDPERPEVARVMLSDTLAVTNEPTNPRSIDDDGTIRYFVDMVLTIDDVSTTFDVELTEAEVAAFGFSTTDFVPYDTSVRTHRVLRDPVFFDNEPFLEITTVWSDSQGRVDPLTTIDRTQIALTPENAVAVTIDGVTQYFIDIQLRIDDSTITETLELSLAQVLEFGVTEIIVPELRDFSNGPASDNGDGTFDYEVTFTWGDPDPPASGDRFTPFTTTHTLAAVIVIEQLRADDAVVFDLINNMDGTFTAVIRVSYPGTTDVDDFNYLLTSAQADVLLNSVLATGSVITAMTDNLDGTFTATIETTLSNGNVSSFDVVLSDAQANVLLNSVLATGSVITAMTDNLDGTFTATIETTLSNGNVSSFDVVLSDAQANVLLNSVLATGSVITAMTDNLDGTFTATIEPTLSNGNVSSFDVVLSDAQANVLLNTVLATGSVITAMTNNSGIFTVTIETTLSNGNVSSFNVDLTAAQADVLLSTVIATGSVITAMTNNSGIFTATIETTLSNGSTSSFDVDLTAAQADVLLNTVVTTGNAILAMTNNFDGTFTATIETTLSNGNTSSFDVVLSDAQADVLLDSVVGTDATIVAVSTDVATGRVRYTIRVTLSNGNEHFFDYVLTAAQQAETDFIIDGCTSTLSLASSSNDAQTFLVEHGFVGNASLGIIFQSVCFDENERVAAQSSLTVTRSGGGADNDLVFTTLTYVENAELYRVKATLDGATLWIVYRKADNGFTLGNVQGWLADSTTGTQGTVIITDIADNGTSWTITANFGGIPFNEMVFDVLKVQ